MVRRARGKQGDKYGVWWDDLARNSGAWTLWDQGNGDKWPESAYLARLRHFLTFIGHVRKASKDTRFLNLSNWKDVARQPKGGGAGEQVLEED